MKTTPIFYKLQNVEALRYRAVLLRKHFYATEWLPVYQEGAKLGKYWGYYKNSSIKDKVLFTIDKGISYVIVDPFAPESILCTPYEDLPLRINEDTLTPKAKETLKEVLSGKLTVIPFNQDLVDRYFKAEKHIGSINRVIGRNTKLVENYVTSKSYELYPPTDRYDSSILVYFEINGRTYLCQPFSRSHVIVAAPETEIKTITEQDLLTDEAAHPALHGNKGWRYGDGTYIPNFRAPY